MHSSNMLLDDAVDTKKPAIHNPLEQFVLLAKGTKGAACLELIRNVLEAPGVYVFAELLTQPNIMEVCTAISNNIQSNLVNLLFVVTIVACQHAKCQIFECIEFVCLRNIQGIFGQQRQSHRIERCNEEQIETLDNCHDGNSKQVYRIQ